MANNFDPAAVFQLLQKQAVDGDPTDILHIAPCHRLAIGNDGKGFQRGSGVSGWFFRMQAIQIFTHLRAALKTPAGSHVNKLHAASRPVVLQVFQQYFQGVGRQRPVEQNPHVAQWQRLLSANESRFEDALGIRRHHDLGSEIIRAKAPEGAFHISCATALNAGAMVRVEENYSLNCILALTAAELRTDRAGVPP